MVDVARELIKRDNSYLPKGNRKRPYHIVGGPAKGGKGEGRGKGGKGREGKGWGEKKRVERGEEEEGEEEVGGEETEGVVPCNKIYGMRYTKQVTMTLLH